jgi:hypothetical protein
LFAPELGLEAPAEAAAGPTDRLILPDEVPPVPSKDGKAPADTRSIAWVPLLKQSVVFLLVQQAWRITFEEGTRAQLGGPFWDEYLKSAGTLCCWDDGDKFSTNYLFHPLMGSTTSFIFANNHRASQDTPFGSSGRYWGAKAAQGVYSFIYSLNFEIGPLSESSIGNVGMTPGQQTWGDIVVTPAIGVLYSAGEDAMRLYIVDPVMRRNRYWGNTLALVLNPTRSVANLMGGKRPWSGPRWAETGHPR